MSHTRFRVSLHSVVVRMSRDFLLETGNIRSLGDCKGIRRTIWLNSSVFVYELCGFGLKSRCSYLNILSCAIGLLITFLSKPE